MKPAPRADVRPFPISTRDTANYRLNPDGTLEVVADPPAVDPVAFASALEEVYDAWRRHDFGGTRAAITGLPARVARLDMSDLTRRSIECEYLEIGSLAADEAGDSARTAAWLAGFFSREDGPSMRPLYAVALLRLGSQDRGLLAYVEGLGERDYPRLPSVLPPDATPLLRAECAAAWEMQNVSYRLAEFHARRALDLDPRQAASALMLVPYCLRTGRCAEAVRIGRAALPYARGGSLDIVRMDLHDAEAALARQARQTGG